MHSTPDVLPCLIDAIIETINENADAVTLLDQAIGDGDHVINLQRGLAALSTQSIALSALSWEISLKKIGVSLLGNMGGASGSLLGTLFIGMSKCLKNQPKLTLAIFADSFSAGVHDMKKRGKADVGAKTMLDVLIPVEKALQQAVKEAMPRDKLYPYLCQIAEAGVESTREMIALKGRAAFMGERTRGHLDAGAKTCQLMIGAIVKQLS
jgi:dihydroxyacetone kinase-like protein